MLHISWDADRERALKIVAKPSPLKILLKTKDDPFFLERWITHHSNIVPFTDLIIFDNDSTNESVLKTYKRFPGVAVFNFKGMHNNIHDWAIQHDLYRALQSSQHFCFLDTDEFLGAIIDDRWVADSSIIELLKPEESTPATWLFNAAGSDTIFEVKSQSALEQGMLWGKPILAQTPPKAGVLAHTVQFDPQIFNISTVANFFILHLTKLDRAQRIQTNINKLKARGVIPQDATLETIKSMSVKPTDSYNVKLYLEELHKLISAKETPPTTEATDGHIKIENNSSIIYGSPRTRDLVRQHVSDSPSLYERIANWHAQGIKSGQILPLKKPRDFLLPALLPPRVSKAEEGVYLAALQNSRHILQFGINDSIFTALASPTQTITSVDSDVGEILRIREDETISQAEASGRLSLRWADIGPVQNFGRPRGEQYRFKWSSYSSAFWQKEFDLVFIDGLFRIACAVQAALKGCPLILFHDFWNRPGYHAVLEIFDVKQKVDTLAALAPKAGFDRPAAINMYERYKDDPN